MPPLGPWTIGLFGWTGNAPVIAVNDPVQHTFRRRTWDAAFAPTALKGYDISIKDKVDLFIDTLADKAKDGPVELESWSK